MLSSEDSDPDFDLNKETPKQKEKRLKSAEADAFMRMWEFNQTVAPVSHDLPTGNNIQGFTEIARAGIRALDMKKRMEKLEAGTEAEQLNADALDFDKEAEDFPTTAEGMFEFLLNMHNEVEERFGTQREKEAALSRELKMEEREEEEEQSSSSEPEIVTDEYTGMTFNMSKTEAELLAQIGVYEIPVATAEDFEQAESVFPPTAKSAVAAWDLFKGKDKGGFDTVCMRHRVWGTEIEFFIGSTGRLKLRPTEKHQVQLLYADGTWMDADPGSWDFDAEHLFKHMRENPGCGWLEAMGGSDDWIFRGKKPHVPQGVEDVDMEAVRSPDGWTPAQDRFADIDLFNTSYLRPSTAPGWEDIPWECRAIEKQKGFWTVKERGSKLVWCNSMRLSELWLTTEGAYYLGAEEAQMTAPPQAVRLEYGLGGCVDGRNQMLTLRLKEARARLGLPDGGEVEVREGEGGGVRAKLKAWTDLHGWHDLQDRLMGRGMDAWTALKQIKRRWEHQRRVTLAMEAMVPDPVVDNVYKIDGRELQLRGWDAEGMPGTLEDVATGEVVWRCDQPWTPLHPWATEGLRVQHSGGRTRVEEAATGEVIAEFDEEWEVPEEEEQQAGKLLDGKVSALQARLLEQFAEAAKEGEAPAAEGAGAVEEVAARMET